MVGDLTDATGVALGGSFVMTGPRVFSSCRAAVTDGLSTGLGTSSKLDASSSELSTSSLSANLLAMADIDALLSFISGGGARETGLFTGSGAGSAFGLGGSVLVAAGAATGVSRGL